MTKPIVVEGCQLLCSAGQGTISITAGQTSLKAKAGGKAIYKTMAFTITNYVGGAITDGNGTGAGSIIATSIHTKVEGNRVFLEGDVSASVSLSGTASGFPATAVDVVRIQSAGQTKIKGA